LNTAGYRTGGCQRVYHSGMSSRRLSTEDEDERTVKARRDGEIGIDGARDLSEGTVPTDWSRGDEHAGFGRVIHLHRQVSIGKVANREGDNSPGKRCRPARRSAEPSPTSCPVLPQWTRSPRLQYQRRIYILTRLCVPLSTTVIVSWSSNRSQHNHSHSLCVATAPPRPNSRSLTPPTSITLDVASSTIWRLCTSYSDVLNFSSTRTSSISPQTVKTGTGKVMAPERRWGNWERGKWIEDLLRASIRAARPSEGGMSRSWVRVAGGMSGEYCRRCRRILGRWDQYGDRGGARRPSRSRRERRREGG
jgi:hypothetical protein